jgi:hypothetical protein
MSFRTPLPSIQPPLRLNRPAQPATAPAAKVNVTPGPAHELVIMPVTDFDQFLKSKGLPGIAAPGKTATELGLMAGELYHLSKVFRDFGIRGQYRISIRQGKAYIIFKGSPGLRKVITGTRYLAMNSKVVAFGVGKAGIAANVRMGSVVSLVFVNAWNVANYFVSQDASFAQLLASITSDSTKVLLAGLASYAVGLGIAAVTSSVVLPLVGGFLAGILVSRGLDYLDERYHITEYLTTWFDRQLAAIRRKGDAAWREIQETAQAVTRSVTTALRGAGKVSELVHGFQEWRRWIEQWLLVPAMPRL